MFFANGSITSNAANVAEFFHQLSRGEVLQPESTAQLFDFVSTGAVAGDTTANQVADGGFYGLGVTADLFPWGETRSAGGSIPGYRSDVNYFPGDDTTIAVLTNGSSEFDDLLKFGLFTRAFSAALANTLELADTSAINGTENDDLLTGTRESDIINGLEGNDTLLGEDGVDALDGGRGNDSLNGGKDRDVLFGKEGNDLLDGGEDNDLINGGIGNDDLKGSTGADSLLGSQGDDRLDGGEDNDLLDGGAGSDRLTDTRGNNSLYGNDGDDFLFTGMGDDRLAGDEGNDRLEANSGNDRLFGNEGDDFLNGGEDNDSLLGGSGNDALVGLSGNDTFTGGDGSDRFVLQPGAIATIADFTDGQDLLELSTGLTYADLNIMQGQGDNASDTLITLNENDEILAILTGVNAGAIAPTDFAMT
jgi:Ca2+-binding RTX toxin-like protein